ncbi:TerB family tellurite resistance protein [Maricaulis sp.]|uniref:TerB family tellurite resistance protein n=1 Tax=Maricaulis sp. TaxID=1486257 RepID=UPI003A93E5A6
MASFEKPSTEAGIIAHAVCGAYLMVAFSDGQYAQSEKIRMVHGLLSKNVPAGVVKADLEAALPAIENAFAADYETVAKRVLELIASVSGNGIAKRAIIHAAQTAVVADNALVPQEAGALERISDALGLKKGAI